MAFARQQFNPAEILTHSTLVQMFATVFGEESANALLESADDKFQAIFLNALQMVLRASGGNRNMVIDVQLTLAVNYAKFMAQHRDIPKASQDGVMRQLIRSAGWPTEFKQEVYRQLFDLGAAKYAASNFTVFEYDRSQQE